MFMSMFKCFCLYIVLFLFGTVVQILLFFLSDSPRSPDVKANAAKCEEAKTPSKKQTERRAIAARSDAVPKSPATPSPRHKKGNHLLHGGGCGCTVIVH